MNAQPDQQFDSSDPAPFGTRPRRAPGALCALGLAYAIWLLMLLWMALFHSNR